VSKRGRRETAAAAIIRSRRARERARTATIVGLCSVAAVAIVAVAAYRPVSTQIRLAAYGGDELDAVGDSPSAAHCQATYTLAVSGDPSEVTAGQFEPFASAQPAFGPYTSDTTGTAVQQYDTTADRPPLTELVGYEQAGYTILWYDPSISATEKDQIQAIAKKFSDETDLRDRFVAAPWTSADDDQVTPAPTGSGFPAGMHIAFTHWSAGGIGQTDTTQQVGAYEYCGAVSGSALKTFMEDWPYLDSPAPTTLVTASSAGTSTGTE
jgi:hypothetical protein